MATGNDLLYSITDVSDALAIPVSTLRYYDDIGLAPASCRRARVRHYDHRGLRRLVLVHLWRQDGALGVRRTAEVMRSTDHEPRNTLLRRSRDELAEQIRKLQEAHDLLSHILECREDDYND
ncbi:MerR family transcriptional regulator [Streptomyces sp. NPDC091215]|uniref:MerR family transcriptional regulator n=1 Tax=Streptomyces sp. NPDC091215 TaxID=3155192 RepID=UPI0034130220